MKLPKGDGELFERDPKTGKKTDARLWDALLGDDTKDRLDGRDPEAIKRRLKEQEGL